MKKQKRKNKWFFVILVFLLVFFLIAFGREYVRNLQVDQYIRDLEVQKEQAEHEQLETMSLIQELSSEYFLESEGRTKQGLGQEGETVIVIQDNQDDAQNDIEVADSGLTNVSRWFYYFFSHETFESLEIYENS